MSQTVAYIRASTDKQDVQNQKYEILELARRKQLSIDEFIDVTISSRKSTKQRRIDELLEKLVDSDTLIVTELSRLGRSTAEVIGLVSELMSRKTRVIVLKQNLDIRPYNEQDMTSKIVITLFSLLAELERDLISLRTKEALAAKKAQGIKLGKPKGTIQKSKFDEHRQTIIELLDLGLSVRKIAKYLGLNNHIGLTTYINKRGLRSHSLSGHTT